MCHPSYSRWLSEPSVFVLVEKMTSGNCFKYDLPIRELKGAAPAPLGFLILQDSIVQNKISL